MRFMFLIYFFNFFLGEYMDIIDQKELTLLLSKSYIL
jgi:hypothetical protein